MRAWIVIRGMVISFPALAYLLLAWWIMCLSSSRESRVRKDLRAF